MLSIIADGVDAVLKEDDHRIHLKQEVAVVVDERLSFWDKSFGHQTAYILQNRYAMGKTGASYKLFLRSDLKQHAENEYKAIWLLGIPDLKPEEQETVNHCRSRKKTVLYTDLQSTIQYKDDAETVNHDRTVFALMTSLKYGNLREFLFTHLRML